MLKKLDKMKIGQRLKESFKHVIIDFMVLLIIIVIAMVYIVKDYSKVLDKYAYPQGDIAMAMNYAAEVRSSTRATVGYDSDEYINQMKEQHEEAINNFDAKIEDIRTTMVTKECKECMSAIDKAWKEYKQIDENVIEKGATTDGAQSMDAQKMMFDELAPKYEALDKTLKNLMSINVSKGNTERVKIEVVLIVLIVIIVIVCVIVAVYSTRLAVKISNGIEKPLNELGERFITFAKGDLDSPMPVVETEDEIAELVKSVEDMAKRIHIIIEDAGRMLNEMAEGNFVVSTEYEEQYTGAFNALLLGMRNMNRQIDSTMKGVNDASEQVLAGSENLAQASQSVAEGATDQAAAVEELQATIDELSNGIRATADELDESYKEAYKYAELAEHSRTDMTAMMTSMQRISETSEKIGDIIAQIEDIASQTNLLSLNASIEAARAGEAGKGFAVVADEIRKLADSSRETANNIQQINEQVIAAVNELSKNSNQIVEYIDSDILPDYNNFVESGRKYSDDSVYINDEMKNFAEKTRKLHKVISKLVNSVSSITTVIEDSARGIENASQGATSLAGEVQKIKNEMSVSMELVGVLEDNCNRFNVSTVTEEHSAECETEI